ncbi:hypothetical protein II906_04420 [bacterium]|nr:hypothetical protein [bacterium]
MKISKGLVEQHIHGAFGVDFMKCSVNELLYCSKKLVKYGVTAFFPTIMTDSLDIIKSRINIVKEAMGKQEHTSAQIAGVHLEGPFINSMKAGIHPKEHIQPLEIEKYQEIEDEIIKIITLAPELDRNKNFVQYLKDSGVKLSLGHSICSDLGNMSQVTHLYNAMSAFLHRDSSNVVSALVDDNIYTELIGDSLHVNDNVLKITFRQKPIERVLLISDALPFAHSDREMNEFAGQKIYRDGIRLVNDRGTLAGSAMLLADIVKNLVDKGILTFDEAITAASLNQLEYHNIDNKLKVYWDDNNSIYNVEFI